VDQATVVCVGFILMVQSVVCVQALASSWRAWPDQDVVRVGLVLLCDATLLIACAALVVSSTAARMARAAWPLTAVAFVGLIAAGGLTDPSPLPTAALQIIPVNSLQTIQLAVVGFGLAWRPGVGIILLSGPLYIATRHAVVGLSVIHGLDEWAFPAATSLAVLAVLKHLRAGADAADHVAAAAHLEGVRAAARTNAELVRDEARRVIHDDVISALRAAELALAPEQVRTASSWALASLAGSRRLTSLDDFERDLRRASTMDFTLDAAGWAEPPPPRILVALREATAEALRNAERHGHARHADVVVVSSSMRAEVVVTDDGRGLPSDWTMGFGVRESILGRLAQVGGQARVDSGAHGGAVVHLVWPADPIPSGRTGDPVVPKRGRIAGVLAATCAATTVYAALRFPGDRPVLGFAVAGAILLMLAAAAAHMVQPQSRIRRGDVSPLIPVGVLLCGVLWCGLQAAGDGALLSMRSWVVGSVANVLALLAFDIPVRRVLPLLGALVVTVLLFAAHDPTVAVTEPIGALATPVVVAGMAGLLGAALRHGERLVARGQAELAARSETGVWERTSAQMRRRHLDHLEDDVVPFLTRAARTGVADPETARLLSARCRDELYLTSPMDAGTRAAVQSARRRGVTVTLRPGTHDRDSAWPVLRTVLEVADAEHVVTVLPSADTDTARIVVSPPIAIDATQLSGRHDAVRSTFPLSADAGTGAVAAGPV
jgi:hypothetical protein